MTIGRNDSCHCGSGRKYKKCHLAADTAPSHAAASEQTSPLHQLDERVVDDIHHFLRQRFPDELFEEAEVLSSHPRMMLQLAAPWLAYVSRYEGASGAEWYQRERGWALAPSVNDWIEAQHRSWLSMWEVTAVEPGRSLSLRDLFTHDERLVHEVSGSRTLRTNMVILGRVVDHAGVSVLCGMHPVPLRPTAGDRAATAVRRYLRRKTAVPPERLRDTRVAWRMLDRWSDEIEYLAQPPRLVNLAGDSILYTTDRWSIDPVSREAILATLALMDGAREASDGVAFFDAEETVLAQVEVRGNVLMAYTNSIARADAIRLLLERHLASHLGRHIRSHTDPTPSTASEDDEPPPEPGEMSDEEAEIARELKERHYSSWLSESVPALDGKTPREMVRTSTGRRRVEILLRELEIIEQTFDPRCRFDVTILRRALGLRDE
jgi:hypothetical protein